MLKYLKQYSCQRKAWLLLSFTALALELAALWFQHVMLLQPCVLCIYQRNAVFGILGAGLVGSVLAKTPLRFIAILIWLYSAGKGVLLSQQHTMMLLHPSPFSRCDLFVRFPDWLPLDKWLPQVFAASGDCTQRQWEWLGLTMPQWLLGIFVAYFLLGLLVLLVQFLPAKSKRGKLFR